MLCISRTFHECFVEVTGKHTARIGRSDKLVTMQCVKSNFFADHSQISDVNMHQHSITRNAL